MIQLTFETLEERNEAMAVLNRYVQAAKKVRDAAMMHGITAGPKWDEMQKQIRVLEMMAHAASMMQVRG